MAFYSCSLAYHRAKGQSCVTDSEKRRGDTRSLRKLARNGDTFLMILHEVLWSAMRRAAAEALWRAGGFASLSSCNPPGTSLECPAERCMALELLKRVTEPLDLRGKPHPY